MADTAGANQEERKSVDQADTETLAETLVEHESEQRDSCGRSLDEKDSDDATVGEYSKVNDVEDADSIIALKEKIPMNQQTPGEPSSSSDRRRTRGLSALPSQAADFMRSIAQRLAAVGNVERQLRGALNGSTATRRRSGERAGDVFDLLTDIPPNRDIAGKTACRSSDAFKKSHEDPNRINAYLTLVMSLSTLLRAAALTFDESSLWRAWNLLLEELKNDRTDMLIAALCSPDCPDVQICVLLRHLTLARLSGWEKHGSINFIDPVWPTKLARQAVMSSDTYQVHIALNDNYLAILSALLRSKPSVVHRGLDDYVHLVWFKFVVPSVATPSPKQTVVSADPRYNYILDEIARSLHQFTKRLDPALPAEVDTFIHFVGSQTKPDPKSQKVPVHDYAASAVRHMSDVLSCLVATSVPLAAKNASNLPDLQQVSTDDAERLSRLFKDHPALAAGELAHPALPVILFVANLVEDSDRTASLLASADSTFFESLRILWDRSFLLPQDQVPDWTSPYSKQAPGAYVPAEKRTHALRLATYLLAALLSRTAFRTADPAPVHALAARVGRAWFRAVATAALALRAHFDRQARKRAEAGAATGVPLSKERRREQAVQEMYADVLGDVRHLVRVLEEDGAEDAAGADADADAVGVENLVWIFEDVPHTLPMHALSNVLTSSTSSATWASALDILETLSPRTAPHFLRFLTHFVPLLLADSIHSHRRARSSATPPSPPQPDTAAAGESSGDESTDRAEKDTCNDTRNDKGKKADRDAPLFMPHPADRFLMLLASAVRRRPLMGEVVRGDAAVLQLLLRLIGAVEQGRFDADEEDGVGVPTLTDELQKEWRARTCRDLREVLE